MSPESDEPIDQGQEFDADRAAAEWLESGRAHEQDDELVHFMDEDGAAVTYRIYDTLNRIDVDEVGNKAKTLIVELLDDRDEKVTMPASEFLIGVRRYMDTQPEVPETPEASMEDSEHQEKLKTEAILGFYDYATRMSTDADVRGGRLDLDTAILNTLEDTFRKDPKADVVLSAIGAGSMRSERFRDASERFLTGLEQVAKKMSLEVTNEDTKRKLDSDIKGLFTRLTDFRDRVASGRYRAPKEIDDFARRQTLGSIKVATDESGRFSDQFRKLEAISAFYYGSAMADRSARQNNIGDIRNRKELVELILG